VCVFSAMSFLEHDSVARLRASAAASGAVLPDTVERRKTPPLVSLTRTPPPVPAPPLAVLPATVVSSIRRSDAVESPVTAMPPPPPLLASCRFTTEFGDVGSGRSVHQAETKTAATLVRRVSSDGVLSMVTVEDVLLT